MQDFLFSTTKLTINRSTFFNNLPSSVLAFSLGQRKVNYHLRDILKQKGTVEKTCDRDKEKPLQTIQ